MVVIGAGRIGCALQRLAIENDEPCVLVTRTEHWDAVQGPPGDPILVATRNDDLQAVLDRVPVYRRGDLVFIQNGALQPWLKEQRLHEASRGLLFMAVPDRESAPQLGPDPSPFSGTHALSIVRWMIRIGVPAQVVDWARFRAWELEKLCWNAAFGLMCQAHDATVGQVCDAHEPELRELVNELRCVGRAASNVDLENEWLADRLIAYSRTIPDYRGAVKEWEWRNGWFVESARLRGVATPVHDRLLGQIGR